MNDDKTKVFSGTSHIQAMGFKNALTEADIPFYELDKSDSSYVSLLAEIQIYVDAKDERKAVAVLASLNYEQ